MSEDEKYLISNAVSVVNAAIFKQAVVSPAEIQRLIRSTYRTLKALSEAGVEPAAHDE